jgi:alkaline phosphatase D
MVTREERFAALRALGRLEDPLRRGFLGWLAASFAGCALGETLRPSDTLITDRVPPEPFKLGVASGDPRPDGVVLWTRLAPDPLRGGGMPRQAVIVDWEVAADERMTKIVQRGQTLARPELGHSVHVELAGLEAGRWYFYRFRAGREASAVGRTRTAPAPHAPVDRLRFAFTSCHSFQQGLFTGYEHMKAEPLDLVFHLGDYIYEGGVDPRGVRRHTSGEIFTIDDYRNRYALYKSDPLLQAAHAAFPWVVTWDDHELENNYAGQASENDDDARLFLLRRAVAYQAYYEHLPLRVTAAPRGADMELYRRLCWGDLACLHVLDTRQYRTGRPGSTAPRVEDAAEGGSAAGGTARLADPPTMLGPTQEAWLLDGLRSARERWNVIAQGVFVAQRLIPGRTPIDDTAVSVDAWDGYPAARQRLLAALERHRPQNPVVITGDVHANWVADLKASFDDPASATLGSEFVGTSLSSGGDGADTSTVAQGILAANAHIKFHNAQRGYVLCDVTPRAWQTHFRVMPFVTRPGAPIATRASFVIESGRPGVQRA